MKDNISEFDNLKDAAISGRNLDKWQRFKAALVSRFGPPTTWTTETDKRILNYIRRDGLKYL